MWMGSGLLLYQVSAQHYAEVLNAASHVGQHYLQCEMHVARGGESEILTTAGSCYIDFFTKGSSYIASLYYL